jgi:omega-6 fatty acid desaturase (delta-12 desaturase)
VTTLDLAFGGDVVPRAVPSAAKERPSADAQRDLVALTRPFAREDARRSWAHLIVAAGLAATCAMVAAWAHPPLLRAAASVLEGLVFLRLFSMLHDHVHGALLRRSWLARGFFHAFGLLVFTPLSVWEESHHFHHRHTAQLHGAQIGSFPVMTTTQWRAASPLARLRYRASRHPLNLLFGGITVFMIGMSLAPFLRHPRRHLAGLFAFVLHAALALLLVPRAGVATWLAVVAGPFLLSAVLGAYLFYAQHNYPGARILRGAAWTRPLAALESSSYMAMSPVMAWLTGNIGYHHVHHLNEAIPFYRLPEAMAAIPALQRPGVTSLSPRDVAACLRLAVWDPEAQALVERPR